MSVLICITIASTDHLTHYHQAMQRAVLVIKEGQSFLCQGCHWVYGDYLQSILNRHFSRPEAARELVTGNRICSISHDGVIERNTFVCPPIKLRTLRSAQNHECHTVHYYNGKEWLMTEVTPS